MRLGTLLLRDAVITLTELEQSLRAQVLSGGRLGTNLVELGFIDLNTLAQYIAQSLEIPLATPDLLDRADPKLVDRFGAEMAERHAALPLGTSQDDCTCADVVLSRPADLRSIAAIEKHLGLRVRPFVTAELRLYYYLERYYGIRRRARFVRSSAAENAKPRPSKSRRERRATQPLGGLTSPAILHVTPSINCVKTSSEPTTSSETKSYPVDLESPDEQGSPHNN